MAVLNQAEAFGSTESIKFHWLEETLFFVPFTINPSRCDPIADGLISVLSPTTSHTVLHAGVVRRSQAIDEQERRHVEGCWWKTSRA